jgi:hypothetical protein
MAHEKAYSSKSADSERSEDSAQVTEANEGEWRALGDDFRTLAFGHPALAVDFCAFLAFGGLDTSPAENL